MTVSAQGPVNAPYGDTDGDGVYDGCGAYGMMGTARGGFGTQGGLVQTVADALGIDRVQVVGEMAEGSTLAEVIVAQNGDADAIVNSVVADRQAQLDELVASGRLTQDAADALVTRMVDSLNARLDASLPAAGTGLGGFGRGTMGRGMRGNGVLSGDAA
jgi:uncharacterized protein YdbL (DUF1318 family)